MGQNNMRHALKRTVTENQEKRDDLRNLHNLRRRRWRNAWGTNNHEKTNRWTKKKSKQNSEWTWTLNYFDLVGPSSDRTRPAANVIWSVWISFIILFRHMMELHSIILNRRHRRRLRHRHCCASNQAFILFASHFKVDFDSKFILFNFLLLFSSIRFFQARPIHHNEIRQSNQARNWFR